MGETGINVEAPILLCSFNLTPLSVLSTRHTGRYRLLWSAQTVSAN